MNCKCGKPMTRFWRCGSIWWLAACTYCRWHRVYRVVRPGVIRLAVERYR